MRTLVLLTVVALAAVSLAPATAAACPDPDNPCDPPPHPICPPLGDALDAPVAYVKEMYDCLR